MIRCYGHSTVVEYVQEVHLLSHPCAEGNSENMTLNARTYCYGRLSSTSSGGDGCIFKSRYKYARAFGFCRASRAVGLRKH
jgi:hypothetical protein